MSNSTVYLAGPILGCTHGEANDWRQFVSDRLKPHGIVAISPLRCEPLIGTVYQAGYEGDKKFGTAKAIGGKNFFDMRACTMALASFPARSPGQELSAGTLIEVGGLKMLNKPVAIVTEDPFVAAHPVANYCADWMLDSLGDAIDLIIGLLAGYNGGKNV